MNLYPHSLTHLLTYSLTYLLSLVSLDWLPDLPHLSKLDLSHNRIHDVKGLKNLKSNPSRLSELFLDYNEIKSFEDSISPAFSGLSQISIKGNKLVDLSSFCYL